MSDSTDNKFADYETSRMLKELGYDAKCFGCYLRKEFGLYNINNRTFGEPLADIVDAPLWQDVEKWIWDKHTVSITVSGNDFKFSLENKFHFKPYKDVHREYFKGEYLFDSPITAKIEGIKKVVIFLHNVHT